MNLVNPTVVKIFFPEQCHEIGQINSSRKISPNIFSRAVKLVNPTVVEIFHQEFPVDMILVNSGFVEIFCKEFSVEL